MDLVLMDPLSVETKKTANRRSSCCRFLALMGLASILVAGLVMMTSVGLQTIDHARLLMPFFKVVWSESRIVKGTPDPSQPHWSQLVSVTDSLHNIHRQLAPISPPRHVNKDDPNAAMLQLSKAIHDLSEVFRANSAQVHLKGHTRGCRTNRLLRPLAASMFDPNGLLRPVHHLLSSPAFALHRLVRINVRLLHRPKCGCSCGIPVHHPPTESDHHAPLKGETKARHVASTTETVQTTDFEKTDQPAVTVVKAMEEVERTLDSKTTKWLGPSTTGTPTSTHDAHERLHHILTRLALKVHKPGNVQEAHVAGHFPMCPLSMHMKHIVLPFLNHDGSVPPPHELLRSEHPAFSSPLLMRRLIQRLRSAPSCTCHQDVLGDVPRPFPDANRPFADSPRAFADVPRPFADSPRPFADSPRPFADSPRPFADSPRAFADSPRVFADSPRGFADAPRAFGDTPRTFGDSPDVWDDLPLVRMRRAAIPNEKRSVEAEESSGKEAREEEGEEDEIPADHDARKRRAPIEMSGADQMGTPASEAPATNMYFPEPSYSPPMDEARDAPPQQQMPLPQRQPQPPMPPQEQFPIPQGEIIGVSAMRAPPPIPQQPAFGEPGRRCPSPSDPSEAHARMENYLIILLIIVLLLLCSMLIFFITFCCVPLCRTDPSSAPECCIKAGKEEAEEKSQRREEITVIKPAPMAGGADIARGDDDTLHACNIQGSLTSCSTCDGKIARIPRANLPATRELAGAEEGDSEEDEEETDDEDDEEDEEEEE